MGQGISSAIGIALGDRMDKRDSKTFVIIGDGELNEGQNWEGFMFAKSYGLDNLIAVIDVNGQQLDGYTKDILDIGDIAEKMKSFGWNTIEVDGHNIEKLYNAIESAKEFTGAPTAKVMHTKKGKGCTFAEDILSKPPH